MRHCTSESVGWVFCLGAAVRNGPAVGKVDRSAGAGGRRSESESAVRLVALIECLLQSQTERGSCSHDLMRKVSKQIPDPALALRSVW